jgi:hypothetical protein
MPLHHITPLAYYGVGLLLEFGFCGTITSDGMTQQIWLVMVEHLSKWIELVPSPEKSSERVAYAFLDRVLSHFGAQAKVLTNQGTRFQGEFQVLCDKVLIDH